MCLLPGSGGRPAGRSVAHTGMTKSQDGVQAGQGWAAIPTSSHDSWGWAMLGWDVSSNSENWDWELTRLSQAAVPVDLC